MFKLAVLFHPNGTTVLTDTAGVRVMVVDRDVEGADDVLKVEGAPAAVDSLLSGIPKVKPERVAALYSQVQGEIIGGAQAPAAAKPRVVVILNGEAPPHLLVDAPDQVILAVGRASEVSEDENAVVTQLEVWSAEVSATRVGAIFSSVGSQISELMSSPMLTAKDRVQLSYVERHWCEQGT